VDLKDIYKKQVGSVSQVLRGMNATPQQLDSILSSMVEMAKTGLETQNKLQQLQDERKEKEKEVGRQEKKKRQENLDRVKEADREAGRSLDLISAMGDWMKQEAPPTTRRIYGFEDKQMEDLYKTYSQLPSDRKLGELVHRTTGVFSVISNKRKAHSNEVEHTNPERSTLKDLIEISERHLSKLEESASHPKRPRVKQGVEHPNEIEEPESVAVDEGLKQISAPVQSSIPKLSFVPMSSGYAQSFEQALQDIFK